MMWSIADVRTTRSRDRGFPSRLPCGVSRTPRQGAHRNWARLAIPGARGLGAAHESRAAHGTTAAWSIADVLPVSGRESAETSRPVRTRCSDPQSSEGGPEIMTDSRPVLSATIRVPDPIKMRLSPNCVRLTRNHRAGPIICETGQETRRGQPLLADEILTGFFDREDGSFPSRCRTLTERQENGRFLYTVGYPVSG
jgi:hypothetical protein